MKFTVSLILTILPSLLIARGFDDTNQITDLTFFPKAGEVTIRPGLRLLDSSSTVRNSGAATSEEDQKENAFNIEVAYSINDSFQVGGSLALSFSGETETAATSGQITLVEFDGLNDPELFVRYRILEQVDKSYYIDTKIVLSPSLDDRQGGLAGGEAGNSSRGGFLASANLSIGQKFTAWGWIFRTSAIYNGEVTVAQPGTGIEIQTEDAHIDFLLGPEFQFNVTRRLKFSLLGNVLVNGGIDRSSTSSLSTTTTEFDSHIDFIVGAGAILEVLKDKLALNVNLDYTAGGDIDINSSNASITPQTREERTSFDISVGALIQF